MGDSNIGEYRVLPHMPDADFAMTRLRKMVDTVRPILRKYNLYVHVLAEFYPDPGLLGLNTGHGQLIEVRMRCVQRRDEFVSFEAMLDTFLHELAHNHYGSHGPDFQRQWEIYRQERHLLLRGESIGSGGGFFGPGRRLGGTRRPAVSGLPAGFPFGGLVAAPGGAWMHDMSALAADAAQRRLMFAGSGQRLGGSSNAPPSITLEDGTRLVAGCLDRPALGIPGDNSLPKALSVVAAGVNEPPLRPASPPFGGRPPQVIELDDSDSDIEVIGSSTYPDGDVVSGQRTWSCPTCTFANPDIFLCCEVCKSERPSSTPRLLNPPPASGPVRHRLLNRASSPVSMIRRRKTTTRKSAAELIMELDKKIAAKPLGWNCRSCSTFMESKWWTCSLCGTMKESELNSI